MRGERQNALDRWIAPLFRKQHIFVTCFTVSAVRFRQTLDKRLAEVVRCRLFSANVDAIQLAADEDAP